jgi:phage baseplate assembly protein W
MHVDYPFRFDGRGRTAEVDDDAHIRDMIEQVLFTAPGERVNRPTFGSGVLQLVFAPNGDALAAATRLSVEAALTEWLGDLIEIAEVGVTAEDAILRLDVRYVVRRTGEERLASLER